MSDHDTKNVLEVDDRQLLDGELATQINDQGRATAYIVLPDGTEDTFFLTERNMRRAGYYLNTPIGTKMKFRLTRDSETNRIFVYRIEKNKNTPLRRDARTLPWLQASVPDNFDLEKPFYFITVEDSCEFFNGPTDVHITSRLLRNSGYETGLQKGHAIKVRVAVGEAGLGVVAVEYPEGFKYPGRPLD